MKKVAGVSVVGGKDIYVRGLGNRYSNVQLNGSPIPSTNPNKEAPLDILSAGIIENVLWFKKHIHGINLRILRDLFKLLQKNSQMKKKSGFAKATTTSVNDITLCKIIWIQWWRKTLAMMMDFVICHRI